MSTPLPGIVEDVHARAEQHGFTLSCDPAVGTFLAALGDATSLLPTLGHFDLVFADAPGGKLEGLDRSVAALQPRGLLVVADMDLSLHEKDGLQGAIARVRVEMLAMPELHCAELDFGSGVILGTRRA